MLRGYSRSENRYVKAGGENAGSRSRTEFDGLGMSNSANQQIVACTATRENLEKIDETGSEAGRLAFLFLLTCLD